MVAFAPIDAIRRTTVRAEGCQFGRLPRGSGVLDEHAVADVAVHADDSAGQHVRERPDIRPGADVRRFDDGLGMLEMGRHAQYRRKRLEASVAPSTSRRAMFAIRTRDMNCLKLTEPRCGCPIQRSAERSAARRRTDRFFSLWPTAPHVLRIARAIVPSPPPTVVPPLAVFGLSHPPGDDITQRQRCHLSRTSLHVQARNESLYRSSGESGVGSSRRCAGASRGVSVEKYLLDLDPACGDLQKAISAMHCAFSPTSRAPRSYA